MTTTVKANHGDQFVILEDRGASFVWRRSRSRTYVPVRMQSVQPSAGVFSCLKTDGGVYDPLLANPPDAHEHRLHNCSQGVPASVWWHFLHTSLQLHAEAGWLASTP